MDFVTAVFLMLCAHSVCDFALQTEWVATNKNRRIREKFSPEQQAKFQVIWPWLLTAHAMTHGMSIYLLTQKVSLAFAETVAHWITDFGKNETWYGFHTDQIIHVSLKFVWAYLLVYYGNSLI